MYGLAEKVPATHCQESVLLAGSASRSCERNQAAPACHRTPRACTSQQPGGVQFADPGVDAGHPGGSGEHVVGHLGELWSPTGCGWWFEIAVDGLAKAGVDLLPVVAPGKF
jgi:hypothetical protein